MQSSPDAPFGAWQTFRTGLSVAQQKALTIIALAVVCRFIASQAVAGIGTFADTLGISLPPEVARAIVFVVSLPLMFFAVVPLASQAVRTPSGAEAVGAFLERLWRDASVPYRTLSLRTFLRCWGLILVTNMFIALPYALQLLATFYLAESDRLLIPAVLSLGALGYLAFSVWVLLRWFVTFPAMILENLSIRASLGRSWNLTTSHAGGLFRLAMLTGTVVLVLSFSSGFALGALFAPFSEFAGFSNPLHLALFLGQIVTLIFSVPVATACYHQLLGQLVGRDPAEAS